MKSKIRMRERARAQSTGNVTASSRAVPSSLGRGPSPAVPLLQPPLACSPHPAGLDFVLRALFVPVLSCDVKGHVYARVGRCHSVRLARCPDSRRAGPEALAACLLSAARRGRLSASEPSRTKASFQIPGEPEPGLLRG